METFREIRIATEEYLQDLKNVEFGISRMHKEDQLRYDNIDIEKDDALESPIQHEKEKSGRLALINFGDNILKSVRQTLEAMDGFHDNFKKLPDDKIAPEKATEIADKFLGQAEKQIESAKLASQILSNYREDLMNGKHVPARVEDYVIYPQNSLSI